jgi:hypothetical protein
MYSYRYPIQRRVMEERLQVLEQNFMEYDYKINPYHVQPGLMLDVDITSIKKKKATLDGMANVLNEFLNGVSKGFQDAAFASFSRRRSTVREDIAQSFAASSVAEAEGQPAAAGGADYLAALSQPAAQSAPAPRRKAPAGRRGVVDTGRRGGRGRARRRGGDRSGLTEI